MSDLFLQSQRVRPAVALDGGFTFLYPGLDAAAAQVFGEA